MLSEIILTQKKRGVKRKKRLKRLLLYDVLRDSAGDSEEIDKVLIEKDGYND